MIKVLFFAKTKEVIGKDELQLSDSARFNTIDDIRLYLMELGDNYQSALSSQQLLVALNQTMVPASSNVRDGDEVAFFPPVTGG
jgi:molybdopterin synthase sulfur carrier subunit